MPNEIFMFGAGAFGLAAVAMLVTLFFTMERRTKALVQVSDLPPRRNP